MVKNYRILIVDDNPKIRSAYRQILSPAHDTDVLSKGSALFKESTREMKPIARRKYDLIVAETGEKGVKAVAKAVEQQSPFAAAFIDMKMPGIDGSETAKRICTIDPAIKIVIVTAYSEYSPDRIIRIIGRDDILFLRKPFHPEVIRQSARLFTKQWDLENESRLMSFESGRPDRYHSDRESNLSSAEADRLFSPMKPSTLKTGESDKVNLEEIACPADDHLDIFKSIEPCPFCDYGVGYRIRRKKWMYLIPSTRYYRCNRCRSKFLKIVDWKYLSSRLF
ncbi:MAG: response regulator [Deltaproteobacteria bacterium]|nr:response regulator [Deltaproteobacteria bacterium]